MLAGALDLPPQTQTLGANWKPGAEAPPQPSEAVASAVAAAVAQAPGVAPPPHSATLATGGSGGARAAAPQGPTEVLVAVRMELRSLGLEHNLAQALPQDAIDLGSGGDALLGLTTLSDAAIDSLVEEASAGLKQRLKERNMGARPESLVKHSGSGNIEAVRLLLAADASADLARGTSEATRQGHVEVARMLLDASADVTAVYGARSSLLHIACRSGHEEMAQVLLAARADATAIDNAERMPLHIASEHGHAGLAQVLLTARVDAKAVDNAGRMPLHIASEYGHAGLAQVILAARADAKAFDHAGLMPLHIASERGHAGLAQVLVSAGANVHAVAGLLSEPTLQVAEGRPAVGDCVKILMTHDRSNFKGRVGKVIVADRSTKPFGIEFADDGKAAWFAEGDVSKMVEVVESSNTGSAYGKGTALQIAERSQHRELLQVLQRAGQT